MKPILAAIGIDQARGAAAICARLQQELSRRDAQIETLHQAVEGLMQRMQELESR